MDLKKYFETSWLEGNRSLDQYTYSGWALVHKVQGCERVLDVGCGTNPFKGKIPLVYGIDITDVGSDECVSIEEFETDLVFDVAFCLGSLNFGSEETVHNQIKKLVSLLADNSRIYWRCNPGHADHQNDQVGKIDFFPWTVELHEIWSKEFGYTLQNVQSNDNNRIYAEWIR